MNIHAKKTIIFKPEGGLCNRMRSLLSIHKYCIDNNYRLIVVWVKDKGLNCSFNDIFEKNIFKNTIFVEASYNNINVFKNFRLLEFLLLKYTNNIHDIKNINEIKCDVMKSNVIYIRSCEILYGDDSGYDIFKPRKKIIKKLNSFKQNNKMIGIHIRRTDNIDSINKSKTIDFIDDMNMELKRNKDICFFLATDDINTREQIVKTFGEKKVLYYNNKSITRKTRKGIEAAVLDLFMLSRCICIYGSYWSSFSIVASKIGNIPLFISGGKK